MNEHDLRDALHRTMTTTTVPPPMESAPVLAAGRRVMRRRMAAGGAAVSVLAVTAVALVAGPLLSGPGGDGGGVPAAGPPSAAPARTPAPSDKPADGSRGVPGDDNTADAGPRYEQGRKLQAELLSVVPEGWTAPTGSTVDGIPLRDHQAAKEGPAWSYLASVAVASGGGTGRLLAEVHTAGNGLPDEPCALARAFWGMGGECRVVTAAGRKVGVVEQPGDDRRLDRWAAYRHPDGIVVYVAQSRRDANGDGGRAPLAELPLTTGELAALAADGRFHLE